MVSHASTRFILLTLLIALLVQVLVYWPTLHQLPFGDDWGPPLSEINRGERVGPLSFFIETRQPDSYRPMQSLLMWLFGRVDEPMRWPSIRALHFLSSGVAFVVLGLLLRQWRLGRAGVVIAAAVMALHPSLAAPVGSIDGFSSILSCAAVWWGVWMMTLARDRPWLGITLAAVALVVGTLVKEYAFAMTPMAVLAAWFLYPPRWRSAFITAFVMGALTVLLLWARRFVKPTDMELPASDFSVDSLNVLVANALLVPVGGFFFGDSLWLYVQRDGPAIAVALLVVAMTMVALGGGLWRRLRALDVQEQHERGTRATVQVAFLLLTIPAITFPANAVMRMSEMYLCGLVFTVALLAGLAADGWARDRSRARRCMAIAMAAALAISSMLAVRHKIRDMVAIGERTRFQTNAILSAAEGLPEGGRIALLYRADQVPPRATFSSFRLPDCFCVRPPAADCLPFARRVVLLAPENPRDRPDAPVHILPDLPAVQMFDRAKADVVLYWDVPTSRFVRLK